jgi:hypothetical protein
VLSYGVLCLHFKHTLTLLAIFSPVDGVLLVAAEAMFYTLGAKDERCAINTLAPQML